MNWRTELYVSPSKNKLSLLNKIFAIGSCFSDEIGQRFAENKFAVCKPFGTVYNPISIHDLLLFGLNQEYPKTESYSANGDVHFNYSFHSSFSSLSKKEVERKIQESVDSSNNFLKAADHILVTYGTAFVYQLKKSNIVVANCHKMPAAHFEKRLLTSEEIAKSFQNFYSRLKSINPSAKIILTVSPVRHVKDTLELNAVSKSILRVACHAIASQFSDVEYFPAFEILLDDLRDYRFYKSDLLHPTEEAVEYIWEKFVDAYFDDEAKNFVKEWKKIKRELRHRPFQPGSVEHQKFLRSLLPRLEIFQTQVDVSSEIGEVNSYLVPRSS